MPKIEMALVHDDGRQEIVNVGRPKLLAMFGDKFKKASPELYGEMAWLAWMATSPHVPFDDWLDTLEDLDASDEAVAKLRAELDSVPLVSELTKTELRQLDEEEEELRDRLQAAKDPTPPATYGETG